MMCSQCNSNRNRILHTSVARSEKLTPIQSNRIRDAVKASALVTRCVCRTLKSCTPRTAASEPLKPGKGRVAKAEVEGCSGGYTLGFHHLEGVVSIAQTELVAKVVGLLELNWKDEEGKLVRELRDFCGRASLDHGLAGTFELW
jgi:hypothetical protein